MFDIIGYILLFLYAAGIATYPLREEIEIIKPKDRAIGFIFNLITLFWIAKALGVL